MNQQHRMKMLRRLVRTGVFVAGIAAVTCARPLSARVTQIVITKVESPTFGGTSFGSVGQYELIQGTIEPGARKRDPDPTR